MAVGYRLSAYRWTAERYSRTQGAPVHRASWFRGERVLKMDGAFAPRVLRFDTACGCEGCGIA
jgi:hypothetical protein